MSSCRKKHCYCCSNCTLNSCYCTTSRPSGSSVLPAFGSLRKESGQVIDLDGTKVDYDFVGPSANVTLSIVNDTITINESGVYEISMSLTLGINPTDLARGFLFINDIPLNFSAVSLTVTSNTLALATVSKTIQLDLLANDVIDVRIHKVGDSVIVGSSSLTINRIG
ncbi:hypothetical protein ACMYUM_29305 (plasmid) [Priestia megaterium]|uniref:hypothetical protein n=1 Tax=Priestia megaterium TaxID=1404 RepID=UPI001EDAF4D6|nr:hypothetical protein [Priestia megaterium]MDH3155895.1 hypothetical protein [Priestia megaterium]MED4115696.1 hypothetical protein [Priestia megaterium]UKJ83578.1 hypothetical protein H1W83_28335 [Priestia megaterium]